MKLRNNKNSKTVINIGSGVQSIELLILLLFFCSKGECRKRFHNNKGAEQSYSFTYEKNIPDWMSNRYTHMFTYCIYANIHHGNLYMWKSKILQY
jgi:uncharacterized protein YqhQ